MILTIEGDMYTVIVWFDSLDQVSFSARDLFSLIRVSAFYFALLIICRIEVIIAGNIQGCSHT